MALKENINIVVTYINSLVLKKTIYTFKQAQISLLLVGKVTIKAKYLNFAYDFSKKSANMLSQQTKAKKKLIK